MAGNARKLEEKVKQIIMKTLAIEREIINSESKVEDICKDSIQIFSLILALEEEFGKKSEYEDLVQIETVGDIIKYIEKITIVTDKK